MRLLRGLVALGVVARVVLVVVSHGSNDMGYWTEFATSISDDGLWNLYGERQLFNHPPLMGWLASALLDLSGVIGIPFRVLWKLPVLAADVLVLWVLWDALKLRGEKLALTAMAIFACNPVSILVTAFHGNTDSLCAALVLLAAHLHRRGRFFWAGFVIAGAVNVKVVAALALPALLLLLTSRKDLRQYVLGGAAGVLPFIVAMLFASDAFVRNVFAYESQLELWGVNAIALYTGQLPFVGDAIVGYYRDIGRVIAVAAVLALAVMGRRWQWDPYRTCAVAFAAFLVVTPGWGIQYSVWIVPVLAATSNRFSLRYAVVGGMFVAALYGWFLIELWPLRSNHRPFMPDHVAMLGLFAWAVISHFVVDQVRRRRIGPEDAPATVPIEAESAGLSAIRS